MKKDILVQAMIDACADVPFSVDPTAYNKAVEARIAQAITATQSEKIEAINAAQRVLQQAKDFDGITSNSLFIVFSDNNPFRAELDAANLRMVEICTLPTRD